MPNGQPYCFPEFGDSPMLQHVTTCYIRLFSWKCITIDIYWPLASASPWQRRGKTHPSPWGHPWQLRRWIRRIIFVRNSGRHCDNKIQQAQNWQRWNQNIPDRLDRLDLKTCAPMGRPSCFTRLAALTEGTVYVDIVNTMGIIMYYYIHLLIVVFFCIFLLPEFQRQNWLETHQSLLEVHCKTWRCNGETMKFFDPFDPFDPFDHYNFDQFRSSKSSFSLRRSCGLQFREGTRDARDAHLMGGCCWEVELHQRSSQILSDSRGFCDGKTVKHMMYMWKNR